MPKLVSSYEDNIIIFLAHFKAYPQVSIRSTKYDLDLTYYYAQTILYNHGMHSYKFKNVQTLKLDDYQNIIEFYETFLIRMQKDKN